MKEQLAKVEEFHRKHRFTVEKPILLHDSNREGTIRRVSEELQLIVHKLKEEAIHVQQKYGDERLYRLYLSIEELAEQADSMADRNEPEMADALGDRLYVLLGDALTFDIPLAEIFNEIHQSNMTKEVRSEDDPRMRGKGDNYKPPRIKKAIASGRYTRSWEKSLEQGEPGVSDGV